MVGTNKPLPSIDGTYLRKIRKPLIEKKRRERMNQSITQLRALIDDTIKQNVAPMTRVDKADILELTVCHLTKLRHQQPVTMTTDRRMSYSAGFQDCARHVTSFLMSNGLIDRSRLEELNRHLQNSPRREPGYFTGIPASLQTSTPYSVHRMSRGTTDTPAKEVSPIQHNAIYSSVTSPAGSFSYCEDSFVLFGGSPMSLSHETNSSPSLNTKSLSSEDRSASSLLESSVSYNTEESQTVRIGTGSDNMIGHVIQESTWRPWN